MRALIHCAIAAGAVVLGAAAHAGPVGARPASAPACRTGGLVVWLDTRGGAAAGSVYYRLGFTNLSGHVCTLTGYPGVSAADLRGRELGSAASRNPAKPRRLLTLGRGGTVVSVLQIAQALNFPRSVCGPENAAGLRVYPPNQTVSKLVPFPFLACSRKGPVFLTTQVVQKA
jgi:uncharacterized protein DUF4232